jgi:hypothetical protein
MGITHMHARLTGITALTISWAASSSALVHGSMASTGLAGMDDAAGMGAAAGIMMAGVDGTSTGTADFVVGSMAAVNSTAEMASMVEIVSAVEVVSMVVAVSTEVADFMVEADSTVVGTAKST